MMNNIQKRAAAAILCALMLTSAPAAVFAEQSYTVAAGDTLGAISKKFGLSVDEVAKYNNIVNVDRISVGQVLKIPDGAGDAASETTAAQKPAETTAPETTAETAVQITPAETAAVREAAEVTLPPSTDESTPGTSAYISTLDGMDAIISVNFQQTDIRDVLSAFAVSLGYNIILKGATSYVSVKLSDVSIGEALDYVMRLSSLTYIIDGRTIIVGTKDEITSAFDEKIQLTEFRMAYIKAEIVRSQISSLGIGVKTASSGENEYAFIAEGLPTDLAKVRDLVSMIDRAENTGVSEPSKLAQSLYMIETTYMTADDFMTVLALISLPSGVILESKPNTIYMYATAADYEAVKKVLGLVDTPYPETADSAIVIERVDLKYVNVALIEAQIAANSGASILKVATNETSIWLSGSQADIADAKKIITFLDVKDNSPLSADANSTLHTLQLTYITANQLVQALEIIDLPGVGVEFDTNEKTLYLYCTDEQFEAIRTVTATLDTSANALNITSEENTNFREVQLTYITAEQFSQALAAVGFGGGIIFANNPHTLYMWATDTDYNTVMTVRSVVDTPANTEASAETVSSAMQCVRLSFITAAQFTEALAALNLSSAGIIFDANPYAYYTSATAEEMNAILSVKALVDTYENAAQFGTTTARTLNRIDLSYISAQKFSETLASMSLPSGFTYDNPKVLYLYATIEEYHSVISVKSVVDTSDNELSMATDAPVMKRIITTKITSEIAKSIISSLGLDITVISADSAYSLWIYGKKADIDAAETYISQIDGETLDSGNVLDSFEVFTLKYVKAQEMATMINTLGLVNVQAYTYTLPQFSYNIIVAFASNMKDTVQDLIDKLDTDNGDDSRVSLMIDSATTKEVLETRKEVIKMMMGYKEYVEKENGDYTLDEGGNYTYVGEGNGTHALNPMQFVVYKDDISKAGKNFFILYLENATMNDVELARQVVKDLDAAAQKLQDAINDKWEDDDKTTVVDPGT